MKAYEVVGYQHNETVLCTDCVSEEEGESEDFIPYFVGDEQWEDLSCEECNCTLGDIVGISD